MQGCTLTEPQVDQFIDRGYVVLKEAFPLAAALAAQDFLWEKLRGEGVMKDDPSTWSAPMVQIRETYMDPVFNVCMTDRLVGAIEDLIGRDRWADKGRQVGWGWWPVNFCVGAEKEWDIPTTGWHWDGIQFKHTVTAPDQGLLLLPHFSSVGSHGGGTLLAAGSHKIVARYLARQSEPVDIHNAIPELNSEHAWLAELTGVTRYVADRSAYFLQDNVDADGTVLRVVETIAEPGDVVLCHPFLYHAASQNHSGKPRFMCNRTTPLKEPMVLHRPDRAYSAVEEAIRVALNV